MRVEADTVIDLDGHVVEHWDLWQTHLEPSLRARAPRRCEDSNGISRLLVESRLYPTPEGPGRAPAHRMPPDEMAEYRERLKGGSDPRHRLRDMDRDGIDVALLLPSQGLVINVVRDPQLAAGMCRAFNDWLSSYLDADPARLLGAAMVPLQNVGAAVAEARRAVEELGFRAVFLRPNPLHGRTLADPRLIPLYDEIERLDVPIQLHEGCGYTLPEDVVAVDRFENGFFSHMISHTMEQMLAMLTLIGGGVLERFRGLRVAFMEGGSSWVPYWLERMDEHHEQFAWEVPWLRRRPSEVFRDQCVVGCDLDEAGLPYVVEQLGAERVVYSSDYPHSDHAFPSVVRIRERTDLSDESKRMILGASAARFLGLEVAEAVVEPA